MIYNKYVIVFITIVLIMSFLIYRQKNKILVIRKDKTFKLNDKLNDKFYNMNEIYPSLNLIYFNLDSIKKELNKNTNKKTDNETIWKKWPEKKLYDKNGEWSILPFIAFGIIVEKNCNKYPKLWDFISSISNVKIAILSKMGPRMKLKPHRGWGKHSNHVLRCHFGLKIPDENSCYISVSDEHPTKIKNNKQVEVKYHSQDKWLIFDDSKWHYAENCTDEDRIVLILDIHRPNFVSDGTSNVSDTKELIKIINNFKNI